MDSTGNGVPPGTIAWTDLTILDAERIRDFYQAVAGWTAVPVDMGGYADFCMNDPVSGRTVAGICHARGANAHLPHQWLIYIAVPDLDESTRRCLAMGGAVIDGPRPLDEQSRVCVIRDPAGAVAALVGPRAESAARS